MHWMLSYTVNHTMRSENKPPSVAGRARSITANDEGVVGDEEIPAESDHDGHHAGVHDTDAVAEDPSEE